MVITTFADSASAEPSAILFNGERVVNSFPRHDVVKLTDATYILWQQQVTLVLDGYDLLGFLDGTVPLPPRNVRTTDGDLAQNPSALVFKQQDRLLTSWLLSTIDAALLPSFTEARSTCDVWNTASELFAADTGAKQSQLRHELHSLKKGTLSVTAYVTRIKNICSILETSGSRISDDEKLEIILIRLPPEFEGVVSSTSLSTGPLSLQRVVNALVECETRLHRATQEVSLHANLVESASVGDGSVRGGRPSPRGCGRNFKPQIQHLAQRCYYRYRCESNDSPPVVRPDGPPVFNRSVSVPNDGKGEDEWGFYAKAPRFSYSPFVGQNRMVFGQNQLYYGQNQVPDLAGVYGYQMALGPHSGYAHNDPILAHLPRSPGPMLFGHAVGPASGSHRGPRLANKENYVARPDVPSGPITNHVQVSSPRELGPNVGPGGVSVPWLTKPRARVYSGSDPCIGLPRVGDINASNYSDTSGSNVNTAQVGSNDVGGDSYIPMPIGTSSWYLDSGASHHVCRDPTALRDTTPYSGKSSLLMGEELLLKLFRLVLAIYLLRFSYFVRLTCCVCKHSRLGHPSGTVVRSVLQKHNIAFNKSCVGGALKCFTRFQQLIKTQFDKTIKQLQSDWGGEYRVFTRVLASQGIVHRTSKFIHEILGVCFLLYGSFDQSSSYSGATRKVSFSSSIWSGSYLYHLRVFGCCCYPYLRPFTSHKLEFRSQPSMFLGYSPQHKGYQCFLPNGKIVVSRHVVFDETKFLSSKDPCTNLDLNPGVIVSTTVPLVKEIFSQLVVPVADSPTLPSASSPAHPSNDSESPSLPPVPVEPNTPSGDSVEAHAPSDGSIESARCLDVFSSVSRASNNVLHSTNTHPMVTRAKAGIFKPRALPVEAMEPSTIEEALSSVEWRAAAKAEYDALIHNSTWDLVPLHPSRKVIGCKWLFKIKRNLDGTIARQKARLVAKGCSQVPGCDFKETFSPVVKPVTICVILFVAVSRGWPLRQVDVNNAFLNGDLDTEVFMHQPPGYVKIDFAGKQLVCRLKKALYGLRQAPRAWFDKLKYFLVSIGFVASRSDASLLVRVRSESTLYVDDIIITGSLSTTIDWFVRLLHEEFSFKNMGGLYFFLEIEVTRSSTGSLHLCQAKYIGDILTRASMTTAKSVITLMVSSSVMSKDDGECLVDPTEFRSLAGALQYVVLTRPDIAYAPTDRLSLTAYADANWRLDFDDHRSTSGFCVYFGSAPVSWGSKKQQVVSHSTAEAEYRSLATATSAVAVAANPVLHSKFKHVELDLFFVREKVADGSIFVSEVPACEQAADIFTKPFSVTLFSRFRKFLRVFSVGELDECKGSVS
ncbi:hypothetical protein CXB51_024634 [Gossypium anomalum]|uniref:Reverse transcriptase Ty1/copia-type domain-containing protein n=1 Tax=Gossypium anomalum TaxID=47600 RepID=A0A8J5YQD8_9ROSI|nr:hypothetical protein CXB51_024634 [Gossypium anomalum]